MKLFEVYQDMMSDDVWSRFDDYLANETSLAEVDATNMNDLLNESKFLIFEAFGINPTERGKYFIGGSARLFKNPMLLKVLNELDKNFALSVGDLDVVIPGKEQWKTLYNNYTNKDSEFLKKLSKKVGEKNIPTIMERFKKQWERYGGKIYRPGATKDGLGLSKRDIESFDEWRPDLAKDARDIKVRSTSNILSDAVKVGDYYYMSIYDVFDYKSQLDREKERDIVEKLEKFLDGTQTPQEAEILFKDVYNILKEK
jgi:peroxiredoxin family protein